MSEGEGGGALSQGTEEFSRVHPFDKLVSESNEGVAFTDRSLCRPAALGYMGDLMGVLRMEADADQLRFVDGDLDCPEGAKSTP